jgi:large subunit ribosomal protein L13
MATKEKSKKRPSAAQKKDKKSRAVSRKTASKTQVRLAKPKTRPAAKANAGSRMKEKPVGHAPHSARITAPRGEVKPQAALTSFVPKYSNDRKWLLVDADGQTVGRLASQIAMLLRGKHKPSFTPNNDAGDFVIVINAEKVKFTAKKETDKQYHHHSGWIGGLKTSTPARLRETYPDRILFKAVKGMVPRSPLGRVQMGKLMIYAGAQHPHAAQKPVAWKIRYESSEG